MTTLLRRSILSLPPAATSQSALATQLPRRLLLRNTYHTSIPQIRHHQSRTLTTTTSSSTTSPTPESPIIPPPATQPPPPQPQQQQQNTPTFEPLTYHVHRTPSQQLPIYQLAKAGGNKHQTRIRKISGSIEDLKSDLREALGLGEKEIVVNGVNGHIVIKGWRKFDVANFLEGKHF